MRKALASISFIILTAVSYSEGFSFFNFGSNKEENEIKEIPIAEETDETGVTQLGVNPEWARIKSLEEKIVKDPDKGRLSRNQAEYKQALNDYLENHKDEPNEVFRVGDYYFIKGKYEKAFEVFSKSSDIKNKFGAATTARFLSKNETALELYSEIISENPNMAEAYLGRGLVNRNIGNYDGAANDLRKYVSMTGDESGYLGLADVYIAAGKYNEAVAILEQGKGKYPDSKLIQKLLSKAYSKF